MVGQTALLIIDMQVALFEVPGNPTYQAQELLANIKNLLEQAHSSHTQVIYIQHQDSSGPLMVGERGWHILPEIAPLPDDLVVAKRAEDAFYCTTLDEVLQKHGIIHLIICGCRSDYCVDTTCRAAISHGYNVTLVGDAHSTINRQVLTADLIVAHHNATLDKFGPDERKIAVRLTDDILFEEGAVYPF